MILTDKDCRDNIMNYYSFKCKRVASSVKSGEVCSFADGFDVAMVLHHDHLQLLGRKIPITMITDS